MEKCKECGRVLSSDGILDDLDELSFSLCDYCAGEHVYGRKNEDEGKLRAQPRNNAQAPKG